MDSYALIHWQLQFTEGLNQIVWRKYCVKWHKDGAALVYSLILKDAHDTVIPLFCGSICTNTQWSPKEMDVTFYYVTQEGWIHLYPEFKRFSIRTRLELITDLILRLLGFALLISSGYWKKSGQTAVTRHPW